MLAMAGRAVIFDRLKGKKLCAFVQAGISYCTLLTLFFILCYFSF